MRLEFQFSNTSVPTSPSPSPFPFPFLLPLHSHSQIKAGSGLSVSFFIPDNYRIHAACTACRSTETPYTIRTLIIWSESQSPIHTADADTTQNSQLVDDSLDESEQICNSKVELGRVGGVNAPVGTRQSGPGLQFLELLRLVTSDDIMTLLLEKLSVSIKIHVKPLWSLFGQFSKLSTESVGSHKLVVNNVAYTLPTPMRQLSRVGGVYWA